MKRRMSLLGSTGSIGQSTLDVIRAHPDRLSVVALAAGRQWERLVGQTREFRPRLVAIYDSEAAARFREAMRGTDVAVREGMPGLLEAAALGDADTLVSALVGSIGLRPVMAAIESGKAICLANKETLVVGGALVTAAARRKGVPLL
ncbi:MAG: 1-deoxy-D-xylulose 5-phosphate reductoisomerase [bacterium ADurb.Bin374]|nr:MAG: 1-deoxy-D-xylulose 5-phosphate reductoisomerase [bacterium ADurb.Bin374]